MFPIRESAFHCHCRHSTIVYMSTRHFAKFSSQDQSCIHVLTIKPPTLAPAFWGEAHAVGFPCVPPKQVISHALAFSFTNQFLKYQSRNFPLRLSYNMAISPTLPLFHHVALNQNIFSSSLPCGHLLVPFFCSWCSLHLAVCVCRVQHP